MDHMACLFPYLLPRNEAHIWLPMLLSSFGSRSRNSTEHPNPTENAMSKLPPLITAIVVPYIIPYNPFGISVQFEYHPIKYHPKTTYKESPIKAHSLEKPVVHWFWFKVGTLGLGYLSGHAVGLLNKTLRLSGYAYIAGPSGYAYIAGPLFGWYRERCENEAASPKH